MRNVELRKPVLVVPATNATYDVSMPKGHYWLELIVKSLVTGASTTVSITPFVDKGQTQLSNLPFPLYEADDNAAVLLLTMPAGAAGRQAKVNASLGDQDNFVGPIGLINGYQIAVVKGGAVTGELLEVSILATRVE